ncbi:MAG: tRNA 2-selenouridine(34) synthase MnmH [Burkholderiaceae bacterium]|nr:tRNA 2-selenouridine(34) synthase MnmH [Burkholderiaceae bacterium]
MATREAFRISVDELLARQTAFDALIDARSPSEFSDDHLPGAINHPVLDDAERAEVGTLNAKDSPFASRRRGAALVSRNIAAILDGSLSQMPPDWRPVVYCWRGGNRSGSLATVLARVGWRVAVLEGGYRAYRRHVVEALKTLPSRFTFIVIAGRTGTAKSRLLESIVTRGGQSLDLEALASHRGSVLGLLPGTRQPSQKRFESLLFQTLSQLDPTRPVFVESESRKIGQLQIPDALILRMRASACIVVEADIALRTRFLIDEYAHFLASPSSLIDRLSTLVERHGHARISYWQALARSGDWPALVSDLLERHYDPSYDRSMQRNFATIGRAPRLNLEQRADDRSIDVAVDRLASDAMDRVAASPEIFSSSPEQKSAPDGARPSSAPSGP